MKKKRVAIIIIIVVIFTMGYSYHRFASNEITDTYNWITLRNIYYTLGDMTDIYEKQYNNHSVDEEEIKNNVIFQEYLDQMITYEWYLSLSPRLSSIIIYVREIANIDDGGISDKELEYLINVRDNLRIYLDKINDELNEKSIKRVSGIFRKSNVDELEVIFEETEKTEADSMLNTSGETSELLEYKISTETFTDKDIRVEYPQINNLSDDEKQKEINDLIKNEALKVYQKTIEGLEPDQKYEVNSKYEIKYKSPNLLSIAYSSYTNIVPSTYPYNMFYTTNIDINTGEKLLLQNLVQVIDKSFVDLLRNAKYVGKIDEAYEQEIRDMAFSFYENDERLIDELSGKGDFESIYAYITENALGISMPVPHVAGDHVEFEISLKDLKGNVIDFD